MDKLSADLQPLQEKAAGAVDVLGPAPAAGALPETPAVAQQRNALNSSKKQLDDAVKRAPLSRPALSTWGSRSAICAG